MGKGIVIIIVIDTVMTCVYTMIMGFDFNFFSFFQSDFNLRISLGEASTFSVSYEITPFLKKLLSVCAGSFSEYNISKFTCVCS